MKTISNEAFGFPVNMERLERRFRGDASAGFFWEEANYFAHFAVEELSHKGYDWKFVSNIINELNKLGEQQADSDGWRPDWRKSLLEISDEIQIDQKTLHYCIALEGISYAIESYNEGDSHGAAYFLMYTGINTGMAMGAAGEREFLEFMRMRAISYGGEGGKHAAKSRKAIRNQVRTIITNKIQQQFLWNDGAQSIKSITDLFWAEIRSSIEKGDEWQGISNSDLRKGKIGRQSVYDAVASTDPR